MGFTAYGCTMAGLVMLLRINPGPDRRWCTNRFPSWCGRFIAVALEINPARKMPGGKEWLLIDERITWPGSGLKRRNHNQKHPLSTTYAGFLNDAVLRRGL